MSERKYWQRGYQDEPRERSWRRAPDRVATRAPSAGTRIAERRRTQDAEPGMASHEVFWRAMRKQAVDAGWCCRLLHRCGAGVHACINCVSFDTSARFEMQSAEPDRLRADQRREQFSPLFALARPWSARPAPRLPPNSPGIRRPFWRRRPMTPAARHSVESDIRYPQRSRRVHRPQNREPLPCLS